MKHGRIRKLSEAQMNEVVQREWSSRSKMGEAAVSKWSRTDLVGKEMLDKYAGNPTKIRKAALMLENQEKVLKQIMRENLYSTTFGTSVKPEHMLKAVFLGAANSKRGDIFTEYPLTSTDDALFYIQATYEQTLRDGTAGNRSYENMSPFYSGEQFFGTVGTGNGALTTFTSAAMSYLPLIPFKTEITLNGATVAIDNGSGTLVGALLNPARTNSVDYTSGVITLNFLVAPANGVAIVCVYNWNSELATNYANYGTMALELVKYRFNARPMSLGYRISDMTSIMFETTGLGDAKDYMAEAVGQEHARAKDYRAIAMARRVALGNTVATFDTDFAAAGEISYKSHAQRLLTEIGRVGAVIYDDIKRGGITHIVAGSKATEYMKNHDLWKDVSGDVKNGVYQSGTLSDMAVFTCPADVSLVATNEMLLVYKNPQESMDVSILFGTLAEIDASLRYPNFITEGNSCVIEDAKQINGRFVRLMQLQNL
jgi:hypothetical protein